MKSISILLLLLLLVSCTSIKDIIQGERHVYCIPAHNYWEGTYIGVQNLTTGEIVETRLTLKEDSTFELFVEYKGTSKPNIERYAGDFKIDIKNNAIDLFGLYVRDKLHDTFYEIESDSVIIASWSRYKLKKGFSNDLTRKKWYFIPKDRKQSAYFPESDSTLSTIKYENDGHVSVQTKCGYYNGEFDIDDSGLLTVSNLNETKKPCLDSLSSEGLIEFITHGYRYAIIENIMEFIDEDNNIIATFSQ